MPWARRMPRTLGGDLAGTHQSIECLVRQNVDMSARGIRRATAHRRPVILRERHRLAAGHESYRLFGISAAVRAAARTTQAYHRVLLLANR